MYVLSHGCLMSSYKAFFHLQTRLCLSCVLTSSGCICLFVIYAFFSWEASCYESCLVSHDVAIYCMLDLVDPYGRHYRLPFRSWYCILDIILLELVFTFFLVTSSWMEGSALMMSLHSSYYSSFWNVVSCSSEKVSFFFSGRRLCMRSFLQVKCICMVTNIS